MTYVWTHLVPFVKAVMPLQGAVAAITPDNPDVLCHAAVRARNSGVMFAACFDPQEVARIAQLEGQAVQLSIAEVRCLS